MTHRDPVGISPSEPDTGVVGREIGRSILVTSLEDDLFGKEDDDDDIMYDNAPTDNENEGMDASLEESFREIMRADSSVKASVENVKIVEEDVGFECVPCEAPMKMPANPSDPTPDERERHYTSHLPYRSWCPVCVQARAREDGHYTRTKEEREVGLPCVAIDYAETGDIRQESKEADVRDTEECDDLEKDKIVVVKRRLLVGRDKWTGHTFAHLVQCKGLEDPNIVRKVHNSIEELGYRKLLVKTDGEPALVQVQEAVIRSRTQEAIAENPPAHDPQCNGHAEAAVGDVKAQIRAVKIGLESRIRVKVQPDWPIIEWIVPHAAELINRFSMGSDGKTPHYRVFHKFFNGKTVEFGEQVWAKPKRSQEIKLKLSMKSNWVEGTWVGFVRRSNEHLIALPGGGPVLRVRTVKKKPDSMKWNAKAIEDVVAVPDAPNPHDKRQSAPRAERDTRGIDLGDKSGEHLEEPRTEVQERKIREFRINNEILDKYGYTENCPGCDAKQRGTAKASHSRACRSRLEESIKAMDPEDPVLLRRDERICSKFVDGVESAAKAAKAADEAVAEDMEIDFESEGPDVSREVVQEGDAVEEEPSGKRQRIGQVGHDDGGRASRFEKIKKHVNDSIASLLRSGSKSAALLCRRDVLNKIIQDLDENATRKLDRKLKKENDKKAIESKVDVAELYSQPRMVSMAQKMGFTTGFSMDILTQDEQGRAWDLSDPEVQKRAIERWERDAPWLLMASPPCTMFSTLMNLNFPSMDSKDATKKLDEAIGHICFTVFMCIKQARAQRKFVLEHPAGASSWQLAVMNRLMFEDGVERVNFDFCMAGMVVDTPEGPTAAQKRTGIMTNSKALRSALAKRQCQGQHVHAALIRGKAKQCQVYPDEFCKLVCQSVMGEHSKNMTLNKIALNENETKDVTLEINAILSTPHHEDDYEGTIMDQLYYDKEFFDDTSGSTLKHSLAVEARKTEMRFFKKMKVYTKVPRAEAIREGHNVITTKWIDVNKGDEKTPNYRSRLVGRELKLDNRLDLFAATPPLESLRMLCSICASSQGRKDPFRILSIDVRRAYFYAKALRPVYIEIPAEDRGPEDVDLVARLNLSLYGTRDAAQNWAKEYSNFLRTLGFVQGVASPCNFRHSNRELYITVHGDDFTITGPYQELQWLEEKFSGKYEIRSEYLGPEGVCKPELRILNRVLRWTSTGIEYEPDQRHADIIIKDMGMMNAKPVTTPGVAETKEELEEWQHSNTMSSNDSTAYRALAARVNYLSLDRPDIQYAARDVAKHMANPKEYDWNRLKRIARYLVGYPRFVQSFMWQEHPESLHTFTDSDWAGDKISRKSTSGGAAMYGRHMIKSWASTQQIIALSSGEAEFYAVIRGTSQSYGIMSMLSDFGIIVNCTVCTDATAAIGMVHRQGLGKTRHIDVQYLWVQSHVASGKLHIEKVDTAANPADLLTKHLKAELIWRHLEALHCRRDAGRASTAPELHVVASAAAADRWSPGVDWTRLHSKPRLTLFTPMKVANGPDSAAAVGNVRVTTGRFADGREFQVRDLWKTSSCPHRRLRAPWTGETSFVHKTDIDENEEESVRKSGA